MKILHYRRAYYWTHPWEFARHVKQGAQNFCERGRRGWCRVDAWDIHGYLDEILPPMIDQMMKEGCGHPADLTAEEWTGHDGILDQIAGGFRAHSKILEYEWDGDIDLKALQKTHKHGMKLFVKWYDHLWD